MPIFSKLRDFFNRHRNKFVVGGIIITGSVLLTRYAQQKLREWQEREAREFLERTRKQQHFETTERTCNQTIINLMVTLNESLAKVVNTEDIVEELKKNPENKVELWERLKILVFTRASCLIYLTVMLVITLRIQLNIIGGYLFKNPTSVTSEMQQSYLSLIQHLLNEGVEKVAKLIEKEITQIVGSLELKKQLKLTDLESIFWALQTSVATSTNNPIDSLREFIIVDNIPDSNDIYSNMIRDTADLLDSDEVKSIMTHSVSRGFVALGDQIAEFYVPNGSKGGGDNIVHPLQIEIHVAKLIPVINGLLSKKMLPNTVLHQLLSSEKLKALGANVYECFSNGS